MRAASACRARRRARRAWRSRRGLCKPYTLNPEPITGAGGKRLSRKAARKEGRARKAAGDDVARAFKAAQASVDAAELRKAQSATLEALFEALFRVLKHASASGLLALGRPGALQRPESTHLHPSCSIKPSAQQGGAARGAVPRTHARVRVGAAGAGAARCAAKA